MNKELLNFMLTFAVVCVLIIGSMLLVVRFENKHPCLEYDLVCQVESCSMNYYGSSVFMESCDYTDVSCDVEHDRELNVCVVRG